MAPEPRQPDRRRPRDEILVDLLRRERPALLRQARRNSRDDADAEDALSEASVQFLRHYDGPPGRDALRWMMVVVRNCARDVSRRASRWQSGQTVQLTDAEEPTTIIVAEHRRGPAETILRTEETAAIAELIEGLKPDERAALLLLGLGYSYREIAETQGWTKTKVHRCISEGRATVRRLMERGAKP
jgi:RNA polymerase sigma factor (sigma-70 family)